jgi:hypothetical protein
MSKGLANGPAAATILAAGIGCLTFSAITTLEHVAARGREALTFYAPVGSHSGTMAVAVLVWLGIWCALHSHGKTTHVAFGRIFVSTLLLIAVGGLGTFPPFYQAVRVGATLVGIQLPS